VTLNDPAYIEAAQALARRMAAAGDDSPGDDPTDARLAAGYRMALLRAPGPATLEALRTLYDEAYHHYEATPEDASTLGVAGDDAAHAALTVAANTILNLDAFVTKE
jgi:hypothetical protein